MKGLGRRRAPTSSRFWVPTHVGEQLWLPPGGGGHSSTAQGWEGMWGQQIRSHLLQHHRLLVWGWVVPWEIYPPKPSTAISPAEGALKRVKILGKGM